MIFFNLIGEFFMFNVLIKSRLSLCILLSFLLVGCTTFPETTKLMRQVGQSAKKAIKDPNVWVPLAGAAIFALGDTDDDLTEDLSDNNPLFDSIDDARDASDAIRTFMITSAVASSFLQKYNSSEAGYKGLRKSLLVDAASFGVTAAVTTSLKRIVKRTRPEGNTDTSFPSAHASAVFAANTLIGRRLDQSSLSLTSKKWLKVGFTGVSTLGAYARLEGNKHFASDVLMGAAIGHFIAATTFDTFSNQENTSVTVTPVSQGLVVNLRWEL